MLVRTQEGTKPNKRRTTFHFNSSPKKEEMQLTQCTHQQMEDSTRRERKAQHRTTNLLFLLQLWHVVRAPTSSNATMQRTKETNLTTNQAQEARQQTEPAWRYKISKVEERSRLLLTRRAINKNEAKCKKWNGLQEWDEPQQEMTSTRNTKQHDQEVPRHQTQEPREWTDPTWRDEFEEAPDKIKESMKGLRMPPAPVAFMSQKRPVFSTFVRQRSFDRKMGHAQVQTLTLTQLRVHLDRTRLQRMN